MGMRKRSVEQTLFEGGDKRRAPRQFAGSACQTRLCLATQLLDAAKQTRHSTAATPPAYISPPQLQDSLASYTHRPTIYERSTDRTPLLTPSERRPLPPLSVRTVNRPPWPPTEPSRSSRRCWPHTIRCSRERIVRRKSRHIFSSSSSRNRYEGPIA
jgi:hypothetical protein